VHLTKHQTYVHLYWNLVTASGENNGHCLPFVHAVCITQYLLKKENGELCIWKTRRKKSWKVCSFGQFMMPRHFCSIIAMTILLSEQVMVMGETFPLPQLHVKWQCTGTRCVTGSIKCGPFMWRIKLLQGHTTGSSVMVNHYTPSSETAFVFNPLSYFDEVDKSYIEHNFCIHVCSNNH